ncbi:hypothetical protein [Acinetobacter gerneri]|uniref:Uncharacterized protein n=1 Tax=Acinetobacter gerneri DSM 14967 = CIP 107464 = MTCC 9824 TaxID=1120926 RepID=N8YCN1_9GAMM|nr:hypothetical protein [Acinetobacter gerneri]ENV34517.1 hypothetical protein F960_01255 [Acinetobacter gerneri DSM 14967 = CIP 107464 = MTCC 9824]
MKPEIIEALALELTKAIINERSKHESSFDITDPALWVVIYDESLKNISQEAVELEEIKKSNKSTIFD